MLNKKLGLFLLFLFVFIIGCSKKESKEKEKKHDNVQNKTTKENVFRINQ